MRFCKIHRAPSSRRLLFSHLDSPLEQLHPHPASENCERNARNKYVLSVFWAHHPTKTLWKIAPVFQHQLCLCPLLWELSLPQPLPSKSGEGNSTSTDVFPSCSTLSFRVVFVIYCDIVIYSAMLLGRLALIDSLHFILQKHQQPSNQKLKQPS